MKRLVYLILVLSVGNVFGQVPLKGLSSYFLFNQNANDFIGDNDGEVYGALSVSDRFGKDSSAFLFDGIDDYIRIDNPGFSNDSVGTFSAWIKFNSLNGIQYVASVGDEDSQNQYLSLIRFDPDSSKLSIYNGDPLQVNWIFASTVMDTNSFYHVVLTSNSEKWDMYVNNKKENLTIRTGQNKGEWFRDINSIDNFIIGGLFIRPPHSTAYFNGIIDDVRIYSRVLDSTEISELYYESIFCKEVVYDTIKVYDSISVTDTLIIDFVLSNDSELTNTLIKVFPNPTKDKITLVFDNDDLKNKYTVNIVSSIGNEIYNELIDSSEIEIDLSKFGKNGLYILNIINSNNQIVETKKIILN